MATDLSMPDKVMSYFKCEFGELSTMIKTATLIENAKTGVHASNAC